MANKHTIDDVEKAYLSNENNLNHENIFNEEIQLNISDQLILETLLMMIRGNTIKYSSEKKKKKIKRGKTLEEDIKRLK